MYIYIKTTSSTASSAVGLVVCQRKLQVCCLYPHVMDCSGVRVSVVYRLQKLLVVSCPLKARVYLVHCLDRIHVRDDFSDYPHSVKHSLLLKQVVAASAGSHKVDGREDAFV